MNKYICLCGECGSLLPLCLLLLLYNESPVHQHRVYSHFETTKTLVMQSGPDCVWGEILQTQCLYCVFSLEYRVS